MRQLLYILAFVTVYSAGVSAQSYRTLVNEGNDYYEKEDYGMATERYKRGTREDPERIEGYFNMGNAAYRQKDVQAAIDAYKQAATKGKSKKEIAQTLYNVGNSFMQAAEAAGNVPPQQAAQAGANPGQMQKEGYQKAIDAFKESLKLNPEDTDTRYNLVYAMEKLKELQNQQNQNQNKDQQKKQDQKQDKKEDKNEQNKDQQQDQQKQEQQKQQQQQQQKQQQQMTKQQAQQILKALERDEKEVQKKVREQKANRVRVEKDW
ncbi:MAG: hypothetical protein CL946_07635 [Ectothiorhodospiraceae bacterium]|nr:hypothetical protein [Ectothiorhodospiraceae bacterium]